MHAELICSNSFRCDDLRNHAVGPGRAAMPGVLSTDAAGNDPSGWRHSSAPNLEFPSSADRLMNRGVRDEKQKPRILGMVIVLALAAVGGYYAWRTYLAPGLPDGFASSNGRIEATEIDIAAKIAGRVHEILVHEGDFVEAGQVLARMDTSVLEAQRREAEAQLARAAVAVETARSLVRQREAERAAADAVVAQREAELDAAQRLARTEELAERGTAPIQQLDDDRRPPGRRSVLRRRSWRPRRPPSARPNPRSSMRRRRSRRPGPPSSTSRRTSTTASCARRGMDACSIASPSPARCPRSLGKPSG